MGKGKNKKILVAIFTLIIVFSSNINGVNATKKESIGTNISIESEKTYEREKINKERFNIGINDDLLNEYEVNEKLEEENSLNKQVKANADDGIVLDVNFLDTRHKKGIVEIPFKLFHFGNKYHKYYTEIYNENMQRVAYKNDYFPSNFGQTNLTIRWDATNEPAGKYYVRHWSTNETSLKDKYFPFYLEMNDGEYFNTTQSGQQNAITGNLNNPLSAWKNTKGTYQEYSFYDPISYEIRLEEMYIGNEANSIVEYETSGNEDPTDDEQWILMKYYIKNNGGGVLEGTDLIYDDHFYKKNGGSLRVRDMATFGEEKVGMGIFDLELYPGGDGYCWMGILVPKADGYPLLKISNGYNDKKDEGEYSWLNTDPYNIKDGWLEIGDKWYFFENGVKVEGWTYIKNKWYYFDNNGAMQTGWLNKGKSWYYLSGSGVMQTGWFEVNGKWYYSNEVGVMQTGWLNKGKSWYYLSGSGMLQTEWFEVNGKWYYSSEAGIMQTGWLNKGKSWYYLSGSGVMQTGWFAVNGTWYYSSQSGVMQTGWLKNGGSWYYLNGSGTMQKGWKLLSNKWYYFNNSGKMLTNTVVDGWTIDGNGVGTKIK